MEVFVGFRGQSRGQLQNGGKRREEEREGGNGSASWNNKSSEGILEMKRNSWKDSTHPPPHMHTHTHTHIVDTVC